MAPPINLLALPEEIILQVVKSLSQKSLICFAKTCRTVHRISGPLLDHRRKEYRRVWREDHRGAIPTIAYSKVDPHHLADGKSLKDVAEYNTLLDACEAGDVEFLSNFLSKKSIPKLPFKRSGGYYTLLEAASRHIEVVRMLLKEGVVSGGWKFSDAAHLLCMDGLSQKTLDLLIQNGLNLDMTHEQTGSTLLHGACLNERLPSVIELLTKNGLDPYTRDKDANTPLSIALEVYEDTKKEEFLDLIRALVTSASNNKRPCRGISESHALHYAAQMGDVKLTKLLLEHGADVNARDGDNITPVNHTESEACAAVLLEAGADLSIAIGTTSHKTYSNQLQHAIDENHAILRVLFDAWMARFGIHHCPATVFVAAACLGEVSVVEKLLSLIKTDPDYETYNEDRALFAAVQMMTQSVYESIQELLPEDETDIQDYVSKLEARKAAYFAVESTHEKVIQFLLDRTPDLDPHSVRTKLYPETALGMAIVCGPRRIAEALLSRLQPAETFDSSWNEILTATLLSGPHFVKLVLDRISCPIKASDMRRTLESAVDMGHPEICRLLLDRVGSVAEMEPDPKGHDTHLLLVAVGKGRYEIVKMLIERNASLQITDAVGSTALSQAISHKHPDIALLLISAGCDVRFAIEKFRDTAYLLSKVAKIGHCGLAKQILDRAADIDEAIKGTMLINATEAGHVEMVKFLLEEQKASIGHTDNRGRTALMQAARCGHAAIVRLLIDAGAEINARDACDIDAFYHATVKYGDYDGRGCVEKYFPSREAFLERLQRQIEVVRILVGKKPDAHRSKRDGRSVFSYLAQHSQVDMMRFFVSEWRVDINEVDAKGLTPLWHACKADAVASAEFLVQAGADIFKSDPSGKNTLLHDTDDEIVKVLYSNR